MNKKYLLCMSILLAAGFAGQADAYTQLGEVGQSTDVRGAVSDGASGTGSVSSSISGTFADGVSSYDSRARAAPGSLGTYINYSYSNGGGNGAYQAGADAFSGDIMHVYDLAHANGVVGVTFSAAFDGTLTSSGSGILGNVYAQFSLGGYSGSPTLGGVPGWYAGSSWSGTVLNSVTENGTTTPGSSFSSYTFDVALDAFGRADVATLLNIQSLAGVSNTGWSATSSGSIVADFYNTVSMSASTQYDTTTVTSEGGSWNVSAPVPEPEIYAMLGIGLGLLGWVGRRRKLQAA